MASRKRVGRRRKRARRIRQSLRVVARGVDRAMRRAFGGRGLKGKRNPWGPGKDFQSTGPITTVAQLKRIARDLLAAVDPTSVMAAAARYAIASPDVFLARPQYQADLLDMHRRYTTGDSLKASRSARKRRGRMNPRRNPQLALVGALNPPLGQAIELRYHRTGGEHTGYYKHTFTSRATVFAMRDGSLRIVGR